jgi:hypothetical protein
MVGSPLTLWLGLRDSPPQHIENWRTGADGARRTATALEPLARAGWTVAHDIAGEFGNRDHVVVGPGGVSLLNSKQLSGVARVRGDVVRLERPENPRATCELTQLASACAERRQA